MAQAPDHPSVVQTGDEIAAYAAILPTIEQHLGRGELAPALQAIEAFIARAPDHVVALTDLATLQAIGGDADGARATLARVLGLAPGHAPAIRKLAALHLAQGDPGAAIAVLQPLLGADCQDVEALCLLGDAAAAVGRIPDAFRVVRMALALAPQDPEVQRRLAALEAGTLPTAAPPRSSPAPTARPRRETMIDLAPILATGATDVPHVIMRLSEQFPWYGPRSDLDILCGDVPAFRAHVLACLQPYLARGFTIDEHPEGPHLHLDVLAPGSRALELRFDLCGSLDLFERIQIDPAFATAVLAEREKTTREGLEVWVPRRAHDLALRFLEFVEWQDRRADKRKHLDYVDAANDFSFLEVINGYTDYWALLDTDTGQASIDLRRKSTEEMLALPEIRKHPVRRQRMDYFMIWGHGLAHTDEILATIRNHPAFRIVTIVRRQVPDIAAFVERVYEADTVPLVHLRAKTQYLLGTPPEILVVLVHNDDPQESYYGEGAFRHIQCAHVKAVKEEIRNRFNPRLHGRRSEDHVIHGSDYESQVRHLLAVLGLPSLEVYRREGNPRIHVPYHIQPFADFEEKELPLAALRASILGRGLCPIEETPHFRYLEGDEAPYRAYHAAHMGQLLTDDHFPAAFDRLRDTFDPDLTSWQGRRNLLLAVPLGDGHYRLLDGVHRAALLHKLGRTTVKVAVPLYGPAGLPVAPTAAAPATPPRP
jgi:hypothetical protein